MTTPPAQRDLPLVSEELMISLSQAKNFHHQADVHQSDGDLEAAIGAVRRVLDIGFPDGAPEAEDTRLDARARLAKLLSAAGRHDEALDVIEKGLASPGRESFFRANLHTVQGEVHEARARTIEATDPEGARAARRAALEAYDRSIQINDRLQREILKKREADRAAEGARP